MYDITNLEKLSAFSKAVPEAMASFQAFDKAALNAGATEQELAETTFVAAALRAGGAVAHGSHLVD